MDARTLVAFLLGAGLTAAAFLFIGGQAGGPGPSADGADAMLGAGEIDDDRPMLRGTGQSDGARSLHHPVTSDTLPSLAPTSEEVEWLGTALKKERTRREAARIRAGDGGVEILERVLEHGADPSSLLASYDAFRAPIVESKETGLALTELPAGETVSFKDGDRSPTVIELGAGTFTLAPNDSFWGQLTSKDQTVGSIVIRGAGMDRTTLVAEAQWSLLAIMGTAKHVVIRDLTIEGGGRMGGILQRGKASMALENVRISGWQRAGHAAAIGISGDTYLACKGCEFVGTGKHSGWAISLRGRALLLCEECRFLHLDSGAVIGSGEKTNGGRAMLRACTFEGSRLTDRKLDLTLEVEGGLARFGGHSLSEEERERLWGVQHAARVSSVSFEAIPPVCTLGALLDVLEKLKLPADEQVVGITLDGVADGRPKQFRVYTLPRSGSRSKTWIADVSRGWPETEHLEKDGGRGLPPHDVVRRARSFVELLRGSEVPEDLEVSDLQYSYQGRDDPHPTLRVGERSHHRMWYLHAETGEVLRRPK